MAGSSAGVLGHTYSFFAVHLSRRWISLDLAHLMIESRFSLRDRSSGKATARSERRAQKPLVRCWQRTSALLPRVRVPRNSDASAPLETSRRPPHGVKRYLPASCRLSPTTAIAWISTSSPGLARLATVISALPG